MAMKNLTTILAATLCLGMSAAFAQETTTDPATTPEAAPTEAAPAAEGTAAEGTATEAPAEGAAPTDPTMSLGQDVGQATDGPGTIYVAAKNGAWEQRCVRTEDGSDPCQLYQLLKDDKDNAVSEISIVGLENAGQAVAGATIVAPLETLLTEQILMQVDGGKGKVYPFTFCAREGCVARIGFTAAEIAGFKKGNKATLTIVPVVAPDQKVILNVSLEGFTKGYDDMIAANK